MWESLEEDNGKLKDELCVKYINNRKVYIQVKNIPSSSEKWINKLLLLCV